MRQSTQRARVDKRLDVQTPPTRKRRRQTKLPQAARTRNGGAILTVVLRMSTQIYSSIPKILSAFLQ